MKMEGVLGVAVVVVVLGLWTTALLHVRAADPDPLMDFCVQANPSMPCASPTSLTGASFKSSLLQAPSSSSAASASTSISTGVTITASSAASFPALSSQGLSLTRVDFHPSGLLPPHEHPRASEILFLVTGSLQVGFIDTENTHYSATLNPGDMFVFPRGLIHYALNTGPTPAVSISGLNSQNPGASFVSQVFTSSPPLPDDVLQKAFSLSMEDVQRFRSTIHKTVQH